MYPDFYHKDPYPANTKTFVSGAFNQSFLRQILYLQNNISSLVAHTASGDNVTIRDICFQPLKPDNTECVVNSVLQYFQVCLLSPHGDETGTTKSIHCLSFSIRNIYSLSFFVL